MESDNPYAHDLLDRKPLVDSLSRLIRNRDIPFALSLDSPFGTGKTTLVRMLMTDLKSKGVHCIYFNAWEVDFATDPLVALISFIDDIELNKDDENEYRKKFEAVKKLTGYIVKRGAVIGMKAITGGVVNIDGNYSPPA
ncbi:MAG: hypothetical protein F4X92_04105 [Gammaproteobacteria bacterium]|nr:hypothetical protein [Gammaproteobacteria bacterium]